MKAVVIDTFGGPEKLLVTEIEKPIPGAGEVLVRNAVAGVGKPDYLVREGIYPYLKKQPPMLTLGNECAGYVEAIGAGVNTCKVGDPVWIIHTPGYGAYAEYICVDQSFITVLPEYIDPKVAPGLLNFFLAYALLTDAGRGTDGKSLFILGGAGGVGTALIKVALALEWEVISAARSEKKCNHLRRLGTTHVFNSSVIEPYDAIMKFTDGRGVDIVFDQWVGEGFFEEFNLLADFGMILVYNWLHGTPGSDFYPHFVDSAIHCHAVRTFSFHVYDNKAERLSKMKADVFDMFKTGQISMDYYHQDYIPLEYAQIAHERLDAGEIIGKLLLTII